MASVGLSTIDIEPPYDYVAAASSIRAFLAEGNDPDSALDRIEYEVPGGHFLLMPAWGTSYGGVKILTLRAGDVPPGEERIRGSYLLYRGSDLAPVAHFDGGALTQLRTPAVTIFAVTTIAQARGRAIERAVVIGTGSQSRRHIEALKQAVPGVSIRVRGRTSSSAEAFCQTIAGVQPATRADLLAADTVITTTTSVEPVIARESLGADVVVAAMGAHGPVKREVDVDIVGGATAIVVESRRSALAESAELWAFRPAQQWQGRENELVTLAELQNATVDIPAHGLVLFESVGCGWEDLAVAAGLQGRAEESER
ncbi:hypothetical protein M3D75_03405 [Microbacterium enclense]|uniref:hypothetical protein n=1 Tax=Microbacterium enclense TaxID=993073 RepID=UPI0021A29BAC|nr:hypothetical protein [Microbacterium enclense]MCT2085155.1 hypothetical protein [Microbacterium enclense]